MTKLLISHSPKDKAWAERVHDVLRKNEYRCLFVDAHPDDGVHASADWERMLHQRLRQSRGVVALCSANWLASPWCIAEAIVARERKRRVFLLATDDTCDIRCVPGANIAAPQIPDFLKDRRFISLAGKTEEAGHEQLLRDLEREGLKKQSLRLPHRPYPGLEPFGEQDAAIFFGRDEETDEVIDVLHRRRKDYANGFVVVVGMSGCGKSSLVRAGVLPQLAYATNGVGATAEWLIVPPFRGGQGLDGLAFVLAKASEAAGRPCEPAAARRQLSNADDLIVFANEFLLAMGAPTASILIILDQLEEVFGIPEALDARAALRLLLDASADPTSPVVVLATLRSDFLNALQSFEGSAERCEQVILYPMPRSRLGEVITGPAERFGIDLEPGLPERMVMDTVHEDALPLLAFTLERLYTESRADRRLHLADYLTLFPAMEVRKDDGSPTVLGGVSAAINSTANAILASAGYTDFSDDDRRKRDLRRVFYSLAHIGDEGEFIRRTVKWKDLQDLTCIDVLQQFVEWRLLTLSLDVHGEQVLSVAHEALFRAWDNLNAWLHQDREALAVMSRITDAAAEWKVSNRMQSYAWPEERILGALLEMENSYVSLADIKDRTTVEAYIGPTDRKELETLLALDAAADATDGSGRFGDAWRLPLSHEARSSVGMRLALLGDHRTGVGLRADGVPDIDWCRIEGREVTIEILVNPDVPNSGVVGRLTRPVETFWIARYPVTIVQFQAFVQDCYRKGKWWLPPGFPTDLTAANWQPPNHRMRHGNHPADNVNWVDAAAFCHWLSDRTQLAIALPTEFQWQLAATDGNPGKVYPWSDPVDPQWDPLEQPWRANTLESELGRSTAVGMYPTGASTGGVMDMAGTIYEWCRNAFDNPDNTQFALSQDDQRVLRGGSWDDYAAHARSTFRLWYLPGYRYPFIGFRVICLSPPSDTID